MMEVMLSSFGKISNVHEELPSYHPREFHQLSLRQDLDERRVSALILSRQEHFDPFLRCILGTVLIFSG